MERLKVFSDEQHPFEQNILKDYTNGQGIPKTIPLHELEKSTKAKSA